MNKTLLKKSNLEVNPIPGNLVLTVVNKAKIEKELRSYFLNNHHKFDLVNPVPLYKLKMTSHLEKEGSHVKIYLFLFGTKGELYMKEFLYISTYDTEVNEIPLDPEPRDIIKPNEEGNPEIKSFAFATKEEVAFISFHLEELDE